MAQISTHGSADVPIYLERKLIILIIMATPPSAAVAAAALVTTTIIFITNTFIQLTGLFKQVL